MVELLKPFAQYTQLTSSDEMTSISMVIPVIIELHLHLEQMSSVHELCQVVNTMQRELEQQFEYITDPQTTNFDPLFVMCTLFNSGYIEISLMMSKWQLQSHLIKCMTSSLTQQQPQEDKEKQLKKYNLLWQMKNFCQKDLNTLRNYLKSEKLI